MNRFKCYSKASGQNASDRVGACSVVVLLAASIATPAMAWAQSEWQSSLSLQSEYTDNANRSSTDETISERQDEVQLSTGGSYENSFLDASVNYQVSETYFEKDSQENRSRLQGDSRLLLGRPHDPVELLVSHSRRTVLNEPDDVDLLRNNDERDILTASPSFRWRSGSEDTLIVSGTYSDIGYRFTPERDSERVSASLAWERGLSQTTQFWLSALQTDIRFDFAPFADYQYNAAFVAYSVRLRQLNYRIQVGYNESEPTLGEGLSSPSYQLDIGYSSGLHQWSLGASTTITDNSAGNGNQGSLGGFNPGDSSAGSLDQLERTSADLTWQTQVICGRCALSVSVYFQEDDYRAEAEDREEAGIRITHDYRFSEQASLNASFNRRDNSFSSDVDRADFQADSAQLRYSYSFARGLELSLFHEWRERTSDDAARGYDEQRSGLGLAYTF